VRETGRPVLPLFRQIHDPASRAFTYLIADPGTRAAVAVDPEPEGTVLPLLGLIDELGLDLCYVLCTHVRDGLPAAVLRVRDRTGAEVVTGDGGSPQADMRVRHGDRIDFGGESIDVIETPGRMPTDVSYLWRDRLFSGDALHVRGCGRTDHPGGDAGTLFDSITQRLLVLPGETLVFPYRETHHRSVSTIAEEREHNPCLAGRSRDEFITERCTR
jgi:sulfur dioxygenase